MFNKLKKVRLDDEGYLIDESFVKYKRLEPIKISELNLLGRPFLLEIPANIKEYMQIKREIESNKKINAWRDAGIKNESIIIKKLSEIDIYGETYCEPHEIVLIIREIEFYHIGE